jgi:murein L,D-transpeptidase YcbB/YkuD
MAWRVAKSLEKLRAQFNELSPRRNKSADGTIGDAAHASRSSDHNPWVKDGSMGVVTALDITHDPTNGIDIGKISEHMRTQKDPRIKYVIANGRIFSSTTSPWTWRTYTGSNPHRSHFHTSVHSEKKHYDSDKSWSLPGAAIPVDPDSPAVRPVLRNGSRGPYVVEVQTILGVKADGIFGPITETAVKDFQKKRKLTVDGIVGAKTWAELDKIEQRGDGEKEGDTFED